MELNGKQRRYLRGLGHHLKPVTVVGRSGITDGVVEQTDAGLEDHELIKVKFGQGYEGGVDEAAVTLAERTGSAVAGRVGRTALLYRPRDEDPRIELP
jgi:RNA-binding protein